MNMICLRNRRFVWLEHREKWGQVVDTELRLIGKRQAKEGAGVWVKNTGLNSNISGNHQGELNMAGLHVT